MEDKKRSLGENDGPDRKRIQLEADSNANGNGSHPVKTEPVQEQDEEEEHGPMTQTDVLNFQKQAIFRQMQTYKRQSDEASKRLRSLEADKCRLQKCISLLDSWWNILLDTLAPNPTASSDAKDLVPKSLLLETVSADDKESAADSVSSILEKKRELILNRLGDVFKGSQNTQVGYLQNSLSEISANYNHLKTENEALVLSNDELKSQVEDLTAKYNDLNHKLLRSQSSTLKKIFGKSSHQTDSKDGVTAGDSKSKSDAAGTEAGSSGEAESTENYKALVEELNNTKVSLEEQQAIVKKQAQQLEEQEKSVLKLNASLREWSVKLANLSEADLEKSNAYQSLKLRNNELVSQNNRLSKLNNSLTEEKNKLVAERESFEASLKDKYSGQFEDLEQQLNKANQDVTRIRSARDEILGELNIKKATENDKEKSLKELRDLTEIRQARIDSLEKEVALMKNNNDDDTTTNGSSSTNLEGVSAEELVKLIEKLQRQNKNLSAEIPGLEAAYAKAHGKATAKIFDALEVDAKLKKLNAEKLKANEKYFSAMRSNDNLNQEIQKLKSQLVKSVDTITQLKDSERSKSSKVSSLEREIAELRSTIKSLESEYENSRFKVTEREKRLDNVYRSIEALNTQLADKDSSIKQHVEAKRAMEIQIEKLKVQLETKRFTSGGPGSKSGVDEQLEALRSIALCSVCSKNWKDTVIKACGHVFCHDCAKDRLNARLRKCPVCNKQYSFNDLLSIHL